MKFKAVIFDLDGTLLNTLGDISDSVNFALEKNGLSPYSEEEYRKMVGHGLKSLVREALGSDNTDLQDRVYKQLMVYYRENCINRTSIYDGIPELLDILTDRGVSMSILSNKEDELVQKITAKLLSGWKFEYIQGTKTDIARKPDPQAALIAVNRMNSTIENTLFIGDSEVDIQTAKNAGLKSAAVCWGFRDTKQLKQSFPDIIAHSPHHLARLIL